MTDRGVLRASIRELAPILLQKLQQGGTAELTITGRSMYPLLLDRVSRVRLCPAEKIKKGDIVLYRRQNGVYVLHRVISLEKDGTFTMCGDGQLRPEKGIERTQIFGVVSHLARKNRFVSVDSLPHILWWRTRLLFRPFFFFTVRCIGKLRSFL